MTAKIPQNNLEDLPEFDFDLSQEAPADVFSQVMYGATAPANSLMGASLETMSYKANAILQKENESAPNQQELLKRLLLGQQVSNTLEENFYEQEVKELDNIEDIEVLMELAISYEKQEASARAQQEISEISSILFQKFKMCKEHGIEDFLESFLNIDTNVDNIKNINFQVLKENDQKLVDFFIYRSDVELTAQDMPGFELVFLFEDHSELKIEFRSDVLSQKLLEAKVKTITGEAAEILGTVCKKRNDGFWSVVIPLTETEMSTVKGIHGEQAVKDQIQKSYDICFEIATKLGYL